MMKLCRRVRLQPCSSRPSWPARPASRPQLRRQMLNAVQCRSCACRQPMSCTPARAGPGCPATHPTPTLVARTCMHSIIPSTRHLSVACPTQPCRASHGSSCQRLIQPRPRLRLSPAPCVAQTPLSAPDPCRDYAQPPPHVWCITVAQYYTKLLCKSPPFPLVSAPRVNIGHF